MIIKIMHSIFVQYFSMSPETLQWCRAGVFSPRCWVWCCETCGLAKSITHWGAEDCELQHLLGKAVRSVCDTRLITAFTTAYQALFFPFPFFFPLQGSKTGQPPKTSCRPGFSQNFYTVIVSGDVLHGQSILKGEPAAACLALLSDVFFLSLLCSDLSPSLLSVWRETYNMAPSLQKGQTWRYCWLCKTKFLRAECGWLARMWQQVWDAFCYKADGSAPKWC